MLRPFAPRPGVALALAIGLPACSSTRSDPAETPGTFFDSGTPGAGLGVGATCSLDGDCRAGLRCGADKKCQPGRSLGEGAKCTIGAECQDGLYCSMQRVCAKAGTSEAGGACNGDSDCKSGLRCAAVGLSLSCQPEGGGDIGAACKTSAECYAGLACVKATCQLAPPGMPPFGFSSWAGEKCSDDANAPTMAYFRVPRGQDDGDFYRLPFPNDIRTKNGRPDLSGHPSPGTELLGFDPVDRYLRAIETDADGFGIYPTVIFRFSRAPDWDSIAVQGRVRWIDVTPGDPAFGNEWGYFWQATTTGTKYVCPNWLAVRQGQGVTLVPGHTYAVYMTSGIVAADKTAPVQRGPDLEAVLADTPAADAALAAAHSKYAPLREYLKAKSISKDSILTVAMFTVAPARAPAEKLAKAVEALAAPTANGWVKCDKGTASPCPQADGTRACGEPAAEYDELHALVSLPVFQDGTAPYLKPEDGGAFKRDATGAPQPVRTEQVCLSLTVPKGATMPKDGWPLTVYAHGTGGSFRSHVTEGLAKALATASTDGKDTVAFAVLGIDQVQHGPRRGASTASPNDLFFNFANPAAARYNPMQGAADQLALARFAQKIDLPASLTGARVLVDPARIVFWGHSQGATQGSIAVPYTAAYKAAVLSGNGASLMDSLLTKKSPVNIPAVLPFAFGDMGSDGTLPSGINHPVLALLQLWIDPADPLAHAARMALLPPATVPAHHVFQPYGTGDTYSTGATQATYALAAGLGMVAHDASATAPEKIGELAPGTAKAGNLTVDSKPVTALVREYGPSGYDGHFVAQRNPQALADVARFLAQAATLSAPPQVGP
jgi:hypothetical protein